MESAEEKQLYARLDDRLRRLERDWSPNFGFFLDEGQQALARQYLWGRGFPNYLFWGGFEKAGRRILGLFPEYMEPEAAAFPLEGLCIRYREEDKPRHQSVLGSLMALNIKRELVGDILLGEREGALFLLEPAYTLALNELHKVGRAGVKLSPGLPDPLPEPYTLKPISGTVSSLRLDCLVAFFLNLSRERAAQLVRSGAVQRNHLPVQEPSAPVQEGDVLSIRGSGRFVLSQVGGLSQKGRLHLLGHQYV